MKNITNESYMFLRFITWIRDSMPDPILLIPVRAWHARATETAEREESFKLLQANAKLGATAGENRNYDTDAHILEKIA